MTDRQRQSETFESSPNGSSPAPCPVQMPGRGTTGLASQSLELAMLTAQEKPFSGKRKAGGGVNRTQTLGTGQL